MNAGIFGGGGSNGDWQAGRIVKLHKQGVRYSVIGGTSVGALNGLAVATGQVDILEEIWTTVEDRLIYDHRKLITIAIEEGFHHAGIGKPKQGMYSSMPLRNLLTKHFLGKECKIDYLCSVVVVGDGEPNRYMKYQINKDHIINETDLDFVWGSTLIPVVFEPVTVNGMELVDGGLLRSTPIGHTIRHYPVTKMTAVLCQPINDINIEKPNGMIDRFSWAINSMLRNQFISEWNQMNKWNQAARQCKNLIIDGLPVKYIEQDLYFPDTVLGNPLDFNSKKTKPNFYKGLNN